MWKDNQNFLDEAAALGEGTHSKDFWSTSDNLWSPLARFAAAWLVNGEVDPFRIREQGEEPKSKRNGSKSGSK